MMSFLRRMGFTLAKPVEREVQIDAQGHMLCNDDANINNGRYVPPVHMLARLMPEEPPNHYRHDQRVPHGSHLRYTSCL